MAKPKTEKTARSRQSANGLGAPGRGGAPRGASPATLEKPKGKGSKSKSKSKDEKRKKGKGKKKKAPRFTAATADRHELYQLAVQSPEEDARFLRRVYKSIRKKKARHLREDFCGTALLASHWVRRGEQYTAEGFDIDPDPVAWGVEHNFGEIGEAAARCKLHLKDVRAPSHQRPDVRCALNFSYHIFQTRAEMLEYFRACREDLADDGVLVLDIHGGPDAMEETEEEREIEEGFTYVWDQDHYWPATGEYRCHIHFEFEDGTRMDKAFSYDWRLWGLPEIVDCLREAGFEKIDTYWEGTDEDGESGDGNFRKKKRGENCDSWIAYIVAPM